jgi:hypothetical protein
MPDFRWLPATHHISLLANVYQASPMTCHLLTSGLSQHQAKQVNKHLAQTSSLGLECTYAPIVAISEEGLQIVTVELYQIMGHDIRVLPHRGSWCTSEIHPMAPQDLQDFQRKVF